MTMSRPSTHRWIHDERGLAELCRVLVDRPSLALDSESNSGFTYEESLCLLQINDGDVIWLAITHRPVPVLWLMPAMMKKRAAR